MFRVSLLIIFKLFPHCFFRLGKYLLSEPPQFGCYCWCLWNKPQFYMARNFSSIRFCYCFNWKILEIIISGMRDFFLSFIRSPLASRDSISDCTQNVCVFVYPFKLLEHFSPFRNCIVACTNICAFATHDFKVKKSYLKHPKKHRAPQAEMRPLVRHTRERRKVPAHIKIKSPNKKCANLMFRSLFIKPIGK